MITKNLNQIVKEFIFFRENMGSKLSFNKARYIWGRGGIESLASDTRKEIVKSGKEKNLDLRDKKINITKSNLDRILVLNWVRFIGISGSVAAGFVKEKDDIDLFIVVKDECAWIYRGIISLRNIFKHIIRTKRDRDIVKDLFCINYIVEERGLRMHPDLFNFHELMYLIPVYNPNYINYIYKQNLWLNEKFLVNRNLFITKVSEEKRVILPFRILNFLSYVAQVLFMFIARHRPELVRLKNGYKEGKIRFYPKEFKKSVLKELRNV